MRVGHAEHLGDRVRERRRQLNLTLNGVKAAGGPTGPTVIRAEAGQLEDPRPSTLAKLDEALRWTPGSAARAYWERAEPEPLTEPVAAEWDPGASEVSLPVEAMLALLTTQRQLAEVVAGAEIDRARLTDISAALTRQIGAVVGGFATDLLERNHGTVASGGMHPLLEFAFGDVLDIPPEATGDDAEERLYRRWLAGRPPAPGAGQAERFAARLRARTGESR